MGTITARKRKDGSVGYMARVRIMRDGKTYHETETFDRRPAATAWMRNAKIEVGGLAQLLQRRAPRTGLSGKDPRLRCTIMMRSPARIRDEAGKLQPPAIQRRLSEQPLVRTFRVELD
jgi:hypothetical protein